MEGSGKERWALIGGGSGGIGSAIARALAGDGWNVAITFRSNRERAERTVAEVEAAGGQALALQLELTDAEATAAAVAEVSDRGRLAGLVYAAGPLIRMDYIANLSAAEFGAILDADLKACFNLLQPGLKPLREGGGAVIALSTQAVAHYAKRDALSSTPKAAIDALVRGIAVEEGRYAVRANTIGVGMLEGEGMWESMQDSGHYTEEMLAMALRSTPMRRFGMPADIAAMARFLMSDEAAWVSGQTVYVDGGYSA